MRSASLIWRWFAVNDEHPGFLLVDIIPDVGIVVAVRTKHDLTDCPTLDCVAARDFLAIDDQE